MAPTVNGCFALTGNNVYQLIASTMPVVRSSFRIAGSKNHLCGLAPVIVEEHPKSRGRCHFPGSHAASSIERNPKHEPARRVPASRPLSHSKNNWHFFCCLWLQETPIPRK
jgi:hypothetical protein